MLMYRAGLDALERWAARVVIVSTQVHERVQGALLRQTISFQFPAVVPLGDLPQTAPTEADAPERIETARRDLYYCRPVTHCPVCGGADGYGDKPHETRSMRGLCFSCWDAIPKAEPVRSAIATAWARGTGRGTDAHRVALLNLVRWHDAHPDARAKREEEREEEAAALDEVNRRD